VSPQRGDEIRKLKKQKRTTPRRKKKRGQPKSSRKKVHVHRERNGQQERGDRRSDKGAEGRRKKTSNAGKGFGFTGPLKFPHLGGSDKEMPEKKGGNRGSKNGLKDLLTDLSRTRRKPSIKGGGTESRDPREKKKRVQKTRGNERKAQLRQKTPIISMCIIIEKLSKAKVDEKKK